MPLNKMDLGLWQRDQEHYFKAETLKQQNPIQYVVASPH